MRMLSFVDCFGFIAHSSQYIPSVLHRPFCVLETLNTIFSGHSRSAPGSYFSEIVCLTIKIFFLRGTKNGTFPRIKSLSKLYVIAIDVAKRVTKIKLADSEEFFEDGSSRNIDDVLF